MTKRMWLAGVHKEYVSLEPEHRPNSWLYSSVVLLHRIIQVLAGAYLHNPFFDTLGLAAWLGRDFITANSSVMFHVCSLGSKGVDRNQV